MHSHAVKFPALGLVRAFASSVFYLLFRLNRLFVISMLPRL